MEDTKPISITKQRASVNGFRRVYIQFQYKSKTCKQVNAIMEDSINALRDKQICSRGFVIHIKQKYTYFPKPEFNSYKL